MHRDIQLYTNIHKKNEQYLAPGHIGMPGLKGYTMWLSILLEDENFIHFLLKSNHKYDFKTLAKYLKDKLTN